MGKENNFKELLNIDGIGETQIKSLQDFFSNKKNLNVLTKLNENLSIKEEKEIFKKWSTKRKNIYVHWKTSWHK